MTTVTRMIRPKEVFHLRGKKKTAHDSDVNAGLFTRPVLLGLRAVGWPEHEVAALNNARIAGRSDAEIRELVVQLEAARKRVA